MSQQEQRLNAHLPTPQSPHNIRTYLTEASPRPLSPNSHSTTHPHSSMSFVSSHHSFKKRNEALQKTSSATQMMTPESSPQRPRMTSSTSHVSPSQHSDAVQLVTVAESSVSVRRSLSPHFRYDRHSIDSQPPSSSRLPSPSIRTPNHDKKALPKAASRQWSPSPASMDIDDVFSGSSGTSRHPFLSAPESSFPIQNRPSSGKQNAETSHHAVDHRPSHLKRSKRPADETLDDPTTSKPVSVTDSPNTGRRISLFQETSAESFEESLMAGGYGRYRTADWVRQPQPLSVPLSSSTPNLVALLEKTEESPLTEREVRKRRRLEAFRGVKGRYQASASRLRPVELEGKGRVLMDLSHDEQSTAIATPEATPPKRRSRRKRKTADHPSAPNRAMGGHHMGFADAWDSQVDSVKPNWPDLEFPWRLRGEEQAASVRAEEDERLRQIERFLEDESEEDEERDVDVISDVDMWSNEGHTTNRSGSSQYSQNSYSMNDQPSDARMALRVRSEKSKGKGGLCICKGYDDGRQLVQCDSCQIWYHLECIGISNVADLGREEDPWYCSECISRSEGSLQQRSVDNTNVQYMSTSTPIPKSMREPTLVPSEPAQPSQVYDPPFYQPDIMQDSPMTWYPPRVPRTPTRSDGPALPNDFTDAVDDISFSSASSMANSSRHEPHTPALANSYDLSMYNRTPGVQVRLGDAVYQESPFDPTSTPSRGISFGAPFVTPNIRDGWSGRGHHLLNTPSKSVSRGSLGAPTSSFTDIFGPVGKYHVLDDSPIRRSKSTQADHIRPYQRPSSPSPRIPARSSFAPPTGLEDSPIMRSKHLSD